MSNNTSEQMLIVIGNEVLKASKPLNKGKIRLVGLYICVTLNIDKFIVPSRHCSVLSQMQSSFDKSILARL
jgi:hypothetical protein